VQAWDSDNGYALTTLLTTITVLNNQPQITGPAHNATASMYRDEVIEVTATITDVEDIDPVLNGSLCIQLPSSAWINTSLTYLSGDLFGINYTIPLTDNFLGDIDIYIQTWDSENGYALTALIWAGLVWALGWVMLPFLILHTAFAWWQLTSANYVEHYGLLRAKDENGRYERCAPHHSWNSNHVFSNLVLFHLERHSDHHTHPLRRYQSLRHFEDLPQLPNGYFGVYLLAYVPWLWFRVMDKRLLSLPHIRGDLDKVNIDPDARGRIFLQYGRDKMAEPVIS